MILAGHCITDIANYTLPQIQIFSTAINVRRSEDLKSHALAARAAQASGTDFKKFMGMIDG